MGRVVTAMKGMWRTLRKPKEEESALVAEPKENYESELVIMDDDDSTNTGPVVRESEDEAESPKEVFEEMKPVLSFWVMAYIVLLGDATRGLMFPTLWPLVSSFGGTKTNQGVIVAAFSMGRVVVAPTFGHIATRYGYKGVLVGAQFVVAIGALLYTQVTGLRGLLAAQILLGAGCGTLGVTRSYIAESVPKAHRTVYIGKLTALQYAGFTTTPFLGSLMYRIGLFVQRKVQDLHLDAYFLVNALSFPAILIAVGALLAIAALEHKSFIDIPARPYRRIEVVEDSAPEEHAEHHAEIRRSNACAVVGLVLNVITKGSIGCYETIGVMYAQQAFKMSPATVGYVVGACGSIGVFSLLQFKAFAHYFDDVQLMLGGIFVMMLSCLSLIPTNIDVWAAALFMMYSVGYPIGHTAVIGWFAKAMGKRPQGLLMGLFASAGSVARVVFPIATGLVAQRVGMDAVFISIFVVLAVTFVVMAACIKLFRQAIE